MFDLTGKNAVIVGGTSTLGSSMAIGLAKFGANIAIIGRNLVKAEKVAKQITPFGVKIKVFEADVTNESSIRSAASHIEEWAGSVDILINAPGVNSVTPFSELTMNEWDQIMDVNLKGVVLSCQIFSKYMMKNGNGGSIINISYVSSTTPLSKVVTYSASKAGINSITQYLARELAPYKIRVNAIIPGFFPAEQNRTILSEERVKSIMAHTPMNRFGDPEELQGVVVWLSSDKASGFVTGDLIRVDGGFGAMTI
jgi:NAD(P)-dependent dehydrogenase (short-subunit alcohol dehydrogenase family)